MPSNQALIERDVRGDGQAWSPARRLFGLAFKQGTDDLRESPFVVLAEKLIGKGYDVSIFDRSVQIARLTGSNRAYIDREIPHLERLLAAEPADALAGAKLVVVGHVAKPTGRPCWPRSTGSMCSTSAASPSCASTRASPTRASAGDAQAAAGSLARASCSRSTRAAAYARTGIRCAR